MVLRCTLVKTIEETLLKTTTMAVGIPGNSVAASQSKILVLENVFLGYYILTLWWLKEPPILHMGTHIGVYRIL